MTIIRLEIDCTDTHCGNCVFINQFPHNHCALFFDALDKDEVISFKRSPDCLKASGQFELMEASND